MGWGKTPAVDTKTTGTTAEGTVAPTEVTKMGKLKAYVGDKIHTVVALYRTYRWYHSDKKWVQNLARLGSVAIHAIAGYALVCVLGGRKIRAKIMPNCNCVGNMHFPHLRNHSFKK